MDGWMLVSWINDELAGDVERCHLARPGPCGSCDGRTVCVVYNPSCYVFVMSNVSRYMVDR